MIVNVCPAATTKASPDAVWKVLEATDRYGTWTDATVERVEPPGPARAGQVIRMFGLALGTKWTFTIDITDVDPQHRWIDMVARFPFGIDNYEHLTLTKTADGGTLVRFN